MSGRAKPIPKREVLIEKHFDVPGTFQSYYAATGWLHENGYSFGSTDARNPVGILKGDFNISKWHNLNRQEIDALDGVMLNFAREGKITVRIFKPKADGE